MTGRFDNRHFRSRDNAAEFGRIIAGSEVTIIESAGHLPHVEKSEPFVEAVSGFIQAKAA